MTWAGAVAAVDVNLRLAAGDIASSTIKVVKGRTPVVNQDLIHYWLAGSRNSRTGAETFGKLNIERGVAIRGVLWMSTVKQVDYIAALEDRIVALEEAIIARLMADRDCAGHAIGLYIDETAFDEQVTEDNQSAMTVELTAWVDLPEPFSLSL